MSFKRFFLVRLGWAVFGLWLVATIVFFLFFVALHDPARTAAGGERAQPAEIERLTREFHLDAPIPQQYVRFLWRLASDGSTGDSYLLSVVGQPSVDSGEIARGALPATASLVVLALSFSIALAALAGAGLARVRWRRIFNLPIYVAAGLSPIFLAQLLSYRWDALGYGYCDFFTPSADIACGGPRDWLIHLLVPAVTLGLFFAAIYTRIVRAGVAQVLAEKNGEQQRKLRRRLVLVMARVVGRDFGFAVNTAIIVEYLFGIPGLGDSTMIAFDQYDIIPLQAFIIYATGLAIAVHFVVDVIVGALDPDLRAEWPVAGMPKPT